MDFVPEIRQGNYGVQKLFRHIGAKHSMNRRDGKVVDAQERDIEIERRNSEQKMTTDYQKRLRAQQED